jgi:crotonobetainyl-CoA:carnitine CoA-transferase CaiB-like acyl-CoA transferase
VADDGPLSGVRVLDCATVFAGPFAAQLLGDFGADVIKIEHPTQADSLRGHGRSKNGVPLWWKTVGRNKRCIALDLSDQAGAGLLLRLAASADVLVESFRPGTLERWGLSVPALHAANPGLVIVRVTGYGQDGPYSKRPAFGTLIEAMSGFAAMTGEPDGPPTLPPFGLADGVAGIAAAAATMMALYARDTRSGVGQVVDLAILEPLISVLGAQASAYDQLGEIAKRTGNRSTNNAPRNTYQTCDGKWVAVSTSATSVARRVMALVGHPEVVDEDWFATGAGRAAHADLLDGYVAQWVATRTCAVVLEEFDRAQAAVAAVYDIAGLMADPQAECRHIFPVVPDDELGAMRMTNVMFRLGATPGQIRWTGRRHGQDTDEVLATELGLDAGELAELRKRQIIA